MQGARLSLIPLRMKRGPGSRTDHTRSRLQATCSWPGPSLPHCWTQQLPGEGLSAPHGGSAPLKGRPAGSTGQGRDSVAHTLWVLSLPPGPLPPPEKLGDLQQEPSVGPSAAAYWSPLPGAQAAAPAKGGNASPLPLQDLSSPPTSGQHLGASPPAGGPSPTLFQASVLQPPPPTPPLLRVLFSVCPGFTWVQSRACSSCGAHQGHPSCLLPTLVVILSSSY